MTRPAAAAATPQANTGSTSGGVLPGGAPAAPQPAGAGFRAPRPGRSPAAWRALLSGGRLPRRRSPIHAGALSDDAVGLDEACDRPQADLLRSQELSFSNGGGGDQEHEREGGQQERRFRQSSQLRSIDALRDAGAALAPLMAAVRAARSIDELAPLVGRAMASEAADRQAVLTGMARAWLASRPTHAGAEPATLARVKQALVGAGGLLASKTLPDERRAAIHLWLPVYLLHLGRPRSPGQEQQAQERLAMIERGLSRCAPPRR